METNIGMVNGFTMGLNMYNQERFAGGNPWPQGEPYDAQGIHKHTS